MEKQNIVRYYIVQLLHWVAAAFLVFALGNVVCSLVYRPQMALSRALGPSNSLMIPGSCGVYSTEGFGVQSTDRYGYSNLDLPRAETYYLVSGTSHTLARQVKQGERYSDLVNTWMGGDELHLYNISASFFTFPSQLSRLEAMEASFPDATGLIMETNSLNLTCSEMKEIFDQQPGGADDPYEVFEALDGNVQWKLRLKYGLPLLAEWMMQGETFTRGHQTGTGEQEEIIEDQEYRDCMDAMLGELSEYFDGNIIIIYHSFNMLAAGASTERNEKAELFDELCQAHGIIFLNMETVFAEAYEKDHVVPYGFWNTSMGDGHLNAHGHRMIAEAIFQALEGQD